MTAKRRNRKPLFPLGQLYMTPGAQRAITEQLKGMPAKLAVLEDGRVVESVPTTRVGVEVAVRLLDRHRRGDWGCVDREDAASNRAAIRYGNRILSAYPIDPEKPCAGHGDNCLWIITEADRSVTTILLPSEY